MNIYLTGQNNFGNRGCEALVRSTVDVVCRQMPGSRFFVPSNDIARDRAQWPTAAAEGVEFVPVERIPSRFIQWSRVCSRLPFLARLAWPRLKDNELPPALAHCDALLSIGGDNYSLDYDLASLAYFVAIAEGGLQRGLPVMLWGASVGPFSAIPGVEKQMAAHLQRLTRVSVRESHSVSYLASIGVAENVIPVADSAFALRPEPVELAGFWPGHDGGGVLGLNVSPLIETVRRKAGTPGELIAEVETFIRATIRDTELAVLLVPHVAPLDGATRNNDEHLLAAIANRLTDLGPRIGVVPSGMNAGQLKHIISRCHYFIGARTHATVASLSMLVPTISIAYSIKALGINRDLFGHERYVLDTRNLKASTLVDSLRLLQEEESEIRKQLAERIPVWRQRATLGAESLARLAARTGVAA